MRRVTRDFTIIRQLILCVYRVYNTEAIYKGTKQLRIEYGSVDLHASNCICFRICELRPITISDPLGLVWSLVLPLFLRGPAVQVNRPDAAFCEVIMRFLVPEIFYHDMFCAYEEQPTIDEMFRDCIRILPKFFCRNFMRISSTLCRNQESSRV